MNSDLNSASKYVNNLLASRGLLKDGIPIPFANPGESDDAAMRILNLVHDLINKRDRDAEHRESLAMTVRTLKAAEEKHYAKIDRLKISCDEMNRRCAILQGQERILNSTARTAEARAKSLKDESARLKILTQQVRTQCANDIRKRDVQISRMKEKLLDASRGGRGSGSRSSAAIIPGVTLSTSASASMSASAIGSRQQHQLDYDARTDPSLTSETTAFLTQLSQSLSDENETLASMIRNAVSTIKAISGMDSSDDGRENNADGSDDGGEGGNYEDERLVTARDSSHATLAREMDHVLYELKELLNQPNYVPIEDLLYRDREIDRLKTQVKGLHLEWRKAIELVEIVNRRSAMLTAKESSVLDNVIEKGKRTVLEELHLNYEPPQLAAGAMEKTILEEEEDNDEADHTVRGEELDFEAEISHHLSLINPISPNVLEDKSYMEQFSPIRKNTGPNDSNIQTPSILKPTSSAIRKPQSIKTNKRLTKVNAPLLRR